MEAASFNAWQILRYNGKYKKAWPQYRKDMGLSSKEEHRVSKEEGAQARELALKIDKKYGNGAAGGKRT
jgi:hypothetical protein